MVHLNTWKSLENPPDKPFFNKTRKRLNVDGSEGSKASKRPALNLISPGEKVRVRSELIDQLDKFRKLKESGAISEVEYEELRLSVLKDFKDL